MPERWMDDAACATVDPSIFFPEPDWKPAEMAKRVCGTCPVAGRCLEYALANDLNHGIFAGTDAKERAKLRKAARRSA